MRIAVVLATYNGEKFLSPLLDSLLLQSKRADLILVRDDGSSDKTEFILKGYAEKEPSIRLLEKGPRLGTIANFSFLLEEVKEYDLIFLADQDDIWHPDKIEKFASLARHIDPAIPTLIHSDLRLVDTEAKEIAPSFWRYAGLHPKVREPLQTLLMQNNVTGAACAFNSSLLHKALPIPLNSPMHDHWLALTAAVLGSVIAYPEVLVDYRQHDENQVGAKAYGWTRLFKKRADNSKNYAQAEVLLDRFLKEMTLTQNEMVKAFLALPHQSYFASRRSILRHGFYKQGFLRNLSLFLKYTLRS